MVNIRTFDTSEDNFKWHSKAHGSSRFLVGPAVTKQELIDLGFPRLLPEGTFTEDKKFEILMRSCSAFFEDGYAFKYCTVCYTNPAWSVRTQGIPTVLNKTLMWGSCVFLTTDQGC